MACPTLVMVGIEDEPFVGVSAADGRGHPRRRAGRDPRRRPFAAVRERDCVARCGSGVPRPDRRGVDRGLNGLHPCTTGDSRAAAPRAQIAPVARARKRASSTTTRVMRPAATRPARPFTETRNVRRRPSIVSSTASAGDLLADGHRREVIELHPVSDGGVARGNVAVHRGDRRLLGQPHDRRGRDHRDRAGALIATRCPRRSRPRSRNRTVRRRGAPTYHTQPLPSRGKPGGTSMRGIRHPSATPC